MSFPALIDANGASFVGQSAVGGIFFVGGIAFAFGIDTTGSRSISVWSSPDGTTWTQIDAAHRPIIGDTVAFFRVVQDANTQNLFYLVLEGTDDLWHLATFDTNAGSGPNFGLWGLTVYALGNPIAGGPADIPTPQCLQIAFRSVDTRVIISVFGDDSGVTTAEILAQVCSVDPSTGSQSAWITLPNVAPFDGSSWWTACIGMTEGAGGIIHILINRATGAGGGTDFTRTYQCALFPDESFGSLGEVIELRSVEQGELLGIVPIDDFKSDGAAVYVSRSGSNGDYSFDSGDLVVGSGTSAAIVGFSFQTIPPASATGTVDDSGLAVSVPAGKDYGVIFTDSNGLEFGEEPGPGTFVFFSTDDGGGNAWVQVAGDTGGGFGAAAVLLALPSDNIRGFRTNGPVVRNVLALKKMFPKFMKRPTQVGN